MNKLALFRKTVWATISPICKDPGAWLLTFSLVLVTIDKSSLPSLFALSTSVLALITEMIVLVRQEDGASS